MEYTEQQSIFRAKLALFKNFDEAFELVRSAVFSRFNLRRAGLTLVLQVMPANLGAYHPLGSNAIVLNRYLLAVIKENTKSLEIYNAYLFMVLAHEYLHSLGIVDENIVRQMTYDLCKSTLGEDHSSTRMAKEDPLSLFPELKSLLHTQCQGFGKEFEVVRNFDRTNQSYIQ